MIHKKPRNFKKKTHSGTFSACRHSRNQSATRHEQSDECDTHYNIGITERAQLLFEKGLESIPVTPGKKFYDGVNWRKLVLPFGLWPKDHGISLRTGLLSAIDIDIYHADMVAKLLTCFNGVDILKRVGQPPKALVPVICPEVKEKLLSDQWVDQDGVLNRIEILSYGQQFVAYGIHPDTNKPYEWSGELLDHDLPVIPLAMVDLLFTMFNDLAMSHGWTNITVKEKQAKKKYKVRKKTTGNKPGDLYNRCCPIIDILKEYGWKHYRGNYWSRPGKKTGVSGTVFDNNTFWCFTSSTCLTPDKLYDNYGLLTMYEHGGDFSAAAKTIREIE